MAEEFKPKKFVYENDSDLIEEICEHLKCSPGGGNESDPIGCYGCDTQDAILNKHYHLILGEDGNYEYLIKESKSRVNVAASEILKAALLKKDDRYSYEGGWIRARRKANEIKKQTM